MKLLVHLHIYYYNQVKFFLDRLGNISGCDWDLYITENQHNPEIEPLFAALGARSVNYIDVDNRGYDVWPFIKVLKSVNLDDYDLILKIHTKNFRDVKDKFNGLKISGFAWRNELVNSMLGTPTRFARILHTFETQPEIGLVCSGLCYRKTSTVLPEDTVLLYQEFQRLGVQNKCWQFVAGTMFIARADIYKFLQSDEIGPQMFSTYARTRSKGSMAHVYERILSMVAQNRPYTVKKVYSNKLLSIYVRIYTAVSPLTKWLFTIDREGPNKIKYMVLCGNRIRLTRSSLRTGIRS